MSSHFARHWDLDPAIDFLNHGSYGACPRAVLDAQAEYRRWMESEPVRFLARELPDLLLSVRVQLAAFLRCDPGSLALLPNATTGVNTVLRSLALRKGDEIVVSNHEYNACRNAVDAVAAERGARVVVAEIPFPLADEEVVLERIVEKVGERTRLVLVDHVTSPTALVLPVGRLVRELEARDVDVLVDGAHAPGMLDLDLRELDPSYYTGNCHKWLCAPKGAAFLFVRKERQASLRPLVISHGANALLGENETRFRAEFDWTGTQDPTAWLAIPEAIRFMGTLLPGGWTTLRAVNRALALEVREMLCEALAVDPPAPDGMIASMAAIPLLVGTRGTNEAMRGWNSLQRALFEEAQIEVPIIPWPDASQFLLRVSAQIYNDLGQYERLAQWIVRNTPRGGKS